MNPSDPSGMKLPELDAVARGLRAAGAAVDPSELHGSLCGYVAGGGGIAGDSWLDRLQVDVEVQPDAGGALDDLRTVTLGQFAAHDFGLELLIPPDEAPLSERVDGLVAWCRGFLGGFGLAAPPPGVFSEESTEALGDLGRIAASDMGYEDSESDEEALAELVEFARVAALLMHGDCVRGAERRRRAN
jgi:uncharacterized protein YgfB (UPF0149 family)